MPATENNEITRKVNEFYNILPFNYSSSAAYFAGAIRAGNAIKINYPNLHQVILNSTLEDIIDVGCGTGWFSNTIAYYYRQKVLAVDLCAPALERVREISRQLDTENLVTTRNQDLFTLQGSTYSLVNSLGVLHHTHNCAQAVRNTSALVDEGGVFHLGLYHKYGREPFLNLFAGQIRKLSQGGVLSEEEEEAAYDIFRRLNSNIHDETFLRSWFRDQVLHPHETQHTFEEVYEWLKDLGFNILSTSINGFRPIGAVEDLFQEEKKYYGISVRKNVEEKIYFPGFFTVLAQRP